MRVRKKRERIVILEERQIDLNTMGSKASIDISNKQQRSGWDEEGGRQRRRQGKGDEALTRGTC